MRGFVPPTVQSSLAAAGQPSAHPEITGYDSPILYRCRVILQKARIYSEDEANSDMEIDRELLIQNGFDGRIVRYNDGGSDVIAFYPAQIGIAGTRPSITK